jgi:hypothetical protein
MASTVDQYVADHGSSLKGLEVEVLTLKMIARQLDESFSGALLSEFRKFKALCDAQIEQTSPAKREEEEDSLLTPRY